MSNTRIFQFSCEIFSGYKVNVDLDDFDNLQDIIDYCVNNLRIFLKNSNLDELIHKLNNINYHIHDITFENVLLSEPSGNPQFYICNHGCNGY